MAVQYNSSSPYFTTKVFSNYLDVMSKREIPRESDDMIYEIQQVHQYRPDLLAFDLYHDPNLWWVFAARNPNTITDPIWDFVTGNKIFIPKQSTLINALGL